jgi:hypothetical protein
MQAKKGDTLVVTSHRVGSHARTGKIVAIEGEDGAPPYRVLWNGEDHPHLVFPGSDAYIE